jgi:heat shock protein HslJ
MRKQLPLIGSLLAIVVALVAVGVVMATRGVNQAMAEPAGLDGTAWQLVSWSDPAALPNAPITLEVADGSVSGSGGCNTYGGPVTLTDSDFIPGNLFTSLKFCFDTSEAEGIYLSLLNTVTAWQMDNDQLVLTSQGVEALRFAPA